MRGIRSKIIFKILKLLSDDMKPLYFEYLMAFGLYIDQARFLNLIQCWMERQWRASRLRSMPFSAMIDVTNVCNLRCPYCFTGQGKSDARTSNFIRLSEIQRLVEQTGKYLIAAHLYNWGEPFLHPEIPQIIRIFHDAKIFTKIATNLNIHKKQLLTESMDAGLDYLSLSIDGASQTIYSTYRRGGNLSLVLDNLRLILDYRKRTGRETPIV
jgi:MoaA/NifB/PqqE/SkfB family radical SAM enzyme